MCLYEYNKKQLFFFITKQLVFVVCMQSVRYEIFTKKVLVNHSSEAERGLLEATIKSGS